MKYLTTLLLAGAALATNTSIHFFSDPIGCVNNWFGCSNLPIGYCCQTTRPYCQWVQCTNCQTQGIKSYSLPTYGNGDCSSPALNEVTCGPNGIDMCCTVHNHEMEGTCSAWVVPEGQNEREAVCLGTVEPDVLGHTQRAADGSVEERRMEIPKGAFGDALITVFGDGGLEAVELYLAEFAMMNPS